MINLPSSSSCWNLHRVSNGIGSTFSSSRNCTRSNIASRNQIHIAAITRPSARLNSCNLNFSPRINRHIPAITAILRLGGNRTNRHPTISSHSDIAAITTFSRRNYHTCISLNFPTRCQDNIPSITISSTRNHYAISSINRTSSINNHIPATTAILGIG